MYPSHPALIYEWQNLTGGQLRWVAADHMTVALKNQARNADRIPPPHSTSQKKKTLMPHIITLSPPYSIPHMCRGEWVLQSKSWGGGIDSGYV